MLKNTIAKDTACMTKNKCNKDTTTFLAKMTIGDSCDIASDIEAASAYGDGDDGPGVDYDDDPVSSGIVLNNTCLATCDLPGGKGKVTQAALSAMACADFITWAQGVNQQPCTKGCDEATVASLVGLAGQDPTQDCPAAGHTSEVKTPKGLLLAADAERTDAGEGSGGA